MARVYLDTSFFSACVSTRTDHRSIVWKESSLAWWETQVHRHELFISGEVVTELSAPEFPQSEKGLAMLTGLNLLPLSAEVMGLAEILVREKLMPNPAVSGDAIHVAAATLYQMDYLVTWNIRHLANPNKREHMAAVCLRLGLIPPQIVTPDMLQEVDNA